MEKLKNLKNLIGEFFAGKAGLYIVASLAGLLLIYFVFNMLLNDKGDVEMSQVTTTVKSIDVKIDSLKEDQKFILDRLYQVEAGQINFQAELEKNNQLVKKTNYELTKLQKVYNEKIRNVSTYSNKQLDSFFASKYPRPTN